MPEVGVARCNCEM